MLKSHVILVILRYIQYCALHVCVPIKLRSYGINSLFFVFSHLILCYWKIFSYSKPSFLLVKKLSYECSETYLTKPLFMDLFFFTLSPSLSASPHLPLPRSRKTCVKKCANSDGGLTHKVIPILFSSFFEIRG